MRKYITLLLLGCSFIGTTQIPVGAVVDADLTGTNTVVLTAETVTNFLLKKERPLQENIKDIQAFFRKAETVVNKSIVNMRMVRKIIDTQADILHLYQRALNRLNQPTDEDGDGIDDLEFLEKWKHIEILLALTKEMDGVFELFENLIEDDAFTMNDKGRIIYLEKSYKDMLLLKRAMRAQLRRINRQIYTYRSQRRQLLVYGNFFKH